MTRLWIVEDNERYRATLESVLRDAPELELTCSVGSCEQAFTAASDEPPPDLVPGLEPPPDAKRDYGLTAREREILQLVVDGLTVAQVAERLTISYHTANTHVRHIYEKLHVHSRGSAVSKALKERLL